MRLDIFSKALGVDNLENAYLLKEYFLSYASCIYCSQKYSDLNVTPMDLDGGGISDIDKCPGHRHHVFGNFFIEKHMIATIMQQFLVDMGIRTAAPSQAVTKFTELDQVDNGGHSVDVNEIGEYWNEYLTIMPNDLESVWDTIDNGLIRYLQVYSSNFIHLLPFTHTFHAIQWIFHRS